MNLLMLPLKKYKILLQYRDHSISITLCNKRRSRTSFYDAFQFFLFIINQDTLFLLSLPVVLVNLSETLQDLIQT